MDSQPPTVTPLPRELPAWVTDTGRYRVEDWMHAEALDLIRARVPKWTAGTVVAATVGVLGILGAIAAGGVAWNRTEEVPGLLKSVAELNTDAAVNRAEHTAMLDSLRRLERHAGTLPTAQPGGDHAPAR